MKDFYAYRRKPGRGVAWLAVGGVVALLTAIYLTGTQDYAWMAVACASVAAAWLLMPRPVYGIRLDDTHLVLAAWRKPRPIPLDNIAHIQAIRATDEISHAIIYKDGNQEGIFALDLPDEDTLVEVMAERGIPVRGSF